MTTLLGPFHARDEGCSVKLTHLVESGWGSAEGKGEDGVDAGFKSIDERAGP